MFKMVMRLKIAVVVPKQLKKMFLLKFNQTKQKVFTSLLCEIHDKVLILYN
jgi:hypothetical protein